MENQPCDDIGSQVSSDDNRRNVTLKDDLHKNKPLSADIKTSKWTMVKAVNRRILPQISPGEMKLSNIIDELKRFAIEEQKESRRDEHILENSSLNFLKLFRLHLSNFLQKSTFHYIIICLVITDLITVLVDLILAQLSLPCLSDEEMEFYNTTEQRDSCLLNHSVHLARANLFLFYFSAVLLSIFVLEIFISFYTFGWKYYRNPLYLLDSIVVLASFIMEIYFHYGNIGRAGRAAAAIVILRLWKIIRAIHAVAHSITIKNRLLIKNIQEAKLILEEEKQRIEQILDKQEIKIEYFMEILTSMGNLPSTGQINDFVETTWNTRKQNNLHISNN